MVEVGVNRWVAEDSEQYRPRGSELDQIGTSMPPMDYLLLQREAVSKLWRPEDTESKEGILRDRWDGEVFVSAPEGFETGMVGVVGFLGSDIEGLHGTPMTWFFKPRDINIWVGMTQEQRQAEFKRVLLETKRIMLVRGGWGSRRGCFEEYVRGLMHHPSRVQRHEDMNEGILYGVEGVMGSEFSLDVSKSGQLDLEGIQAQPMEVQDHIAVKMSNLRLNEIVKNVDERLKRKQVLIMKLYDLKSHYRREAMTVSEGDQAYRATLELLLMEEEETILSEIGFVRENLAAEIGHSMSGYVTIKMFFETFLLSVSNASARYMKNGKLWSTFAKLGEKYEEAIIQQRERLMEMLSPRGIGLNEIYHKVREQVPVGTNWYKQKPETMARKRTREALLVAWNPVVDVEDVPLQKDMIGRLIMTLDAIRTGQGGARDRVHTQALEIARALPIMDSIMAQKIGKDALAYQILNPAHTLSVATEPEYHAQCQKNLTAMQEVVGFQTRRRIADNVPVLQHLLLVESREDRTVLAKRIRELGEAMVLAAGASSEQVPQFMLDLPNSNHYPRPEEWDLVVEKIWEHEWRVREQRVGRQKELVMNILKVLGFNINSDRLGVIEWKAKLGGHRGVTEEDIEFAQKDTQAILEKERRRKGGI